MIYDLRIYKLMPNKMADIKKRFTDVTLKLFEKHGIRVVGFWENLLLGSNELIYVAVFKDLNELERAWRSFSEDPEWLEVKHRTEAGGAFIDHVESRLLRPLPFSALQ